MATIDLLSDGIGPTYVAVRTGAGHKLGAYLVKDGWFGEITFETNTALLLETNGLARPPDRPLQRLGLRAGQPAAPGGDFPRRA